MTGRGRFLSLLICVIVFLGLLTRSREVLALGAPLLLYLAAAVWFAPDDIRATVTRTVSADRASHSAPIQVAVLLDNGPNRLDELHVEDLLPAALTVADGEPRLVTSLAPGQPAAMSYTVRGARGEFRFAQARAVACDHFGLFSVERALETPARLLVYPQTVRLRRIDIRPRRTLGFAGPIPARRAGTGVEFYGVREYTPGDRLRRINWRASTRHQPKLFTNESQHESLADVGLILDARTQSDVRTPSGALFEHSVRAAASLADLFLGEGHRLGLLCYGPMVRVFPGYGAAQRERVQRALAACKTQMSYAFDRLGNLPTRFFPPGSQLVIVTPLLPADLAGLLRFASLGYAILVISPDPVDFEVRSLPQADGLDLAIRLARLERAAMLRALQRAGIRVVNWPTDRPLDQAISVGLAGQPLRAPLVRGAV